MPKRQKKKGERGSSSVQTARLSTKGNFRKTDRSHPANQEITQQWDIHDDDFYEQMRGVEICPSRFAHRDTTDALGITEDIEALFEKIGLGYIFDLHCDCYTDLTRQFLASARLYHPDEDNPVADKAMFSFIVNMHFHSMTIFQLCDVFGFGKGRQSCVPDFPEHNDFWKFIASGNFISRGAKQTRIRSPVLRYAVRVISSVIYGKTEPAAVTKDELALLFIGAGHLWPQGTDITYVSGKDINIGAVIAEKLAYFKVSDTKRCGFGAVITRILRQCGVFLPPFDRVVDKKGMHQNIFYMRALISSHYLTGPWRGSIDKSAPHIYQFHDPQGREQFVKLPYTAITELTNPGALIFLPPPAFLCARPATLKKKGVASSSTHQQAPHDDIEEEPEDEASIFPTEFTPDMLPPAPHDTASAADLNDWSIHRHQTNNSILLKMWKGICNIKKGCASQPAVSGDSDDDSGAHDTAAGPEVAEDSDDDGALERRSKRRTDRNA
ncbi:hypothetical protein Bca101_068724 [Brassica carinata]